MYHRLKEYSGESHIAKKYATQNRYKGFRLLDVEPGQILSRQGEPSFEVNLLLSGFAHSKFSSSNGKESSTGLYFPSSTFGRDFTSNIDLSMDTVEILAPGQVIAIYRPEMEQLASDPLATNELAIAGGHDAYNLRRLLMIRNQETLFDSLGQLMFLLTKDGSTESPALTQNQIASFINAQRSRVSTALGELVDQEFITRDNVVKQSSYKVTEHGKIFFSSELDF